MGVVSGCRFWRGSPRFWRGSPCTGRALRTLRLRLPGRARATIAQLRQRQPRVIYRVLRRLFPAMGRLGAARPIFVCELEQAERAKLATSNGNYSESECPLNRVALS